MKNIIVLCPYPVGVAAGQRLKYEQYFNVWKKSGYTIATFPFMSDKLWNVAYLKGHLHIKILESLKGYISRIKVLFILHRFEIVYIHQWTTPYGTSFYDFLVRKLSKKLIFDLEDFVLVKNNGVISTSKFIRFFRFSSRTKYLIKNANHVITSSPTLNDYCVGFNKFSSSTFISSSINTERFVPANNYSNDNKIVIGWTGTFSSIPFLKLISDVLIELKKSRDFKLRVISNCDFQLEGMDLEVIYWNKETEVEDLQAIDIGLYPLENSDWVLGKSGLKALQYMSFGIPTVATSVGTSKIIINNDVNGFLVNSKEEWVDVLKKLIDDSLLRKRIGNEARKTILENYSTDVIKDIYLEILNKQIQK